MQDNGRAFRRCLQCPAGSSPDASSGACVPPSGPLRTAASDLAYVLGALNARGAGISTSTATQAVIQGVWEPSGSSRAYTVPQSLPLTSWQGPAARACMDAGDRVACNSLANLCVLQMYSAEAAACQIFDELVTEAAGSSARRNSAAASPRPTTGPLPWLYYVPGTSYLSAEDVDLQVSMSTSAAPLAFVLSVYDINGTWLGMHNWTLQFQVCGARIEEAAKWTRFGVNYASSCSIDLSGLLAQLDFSSNGPRFYDPYLLQASGELYPLPIKLLNKPEIGSSISTTEQSGHVRRFFYIDTQLSISTAATGASSSQAVVYPSAMSLLVQIQPGARNRIYPPLLTIQYSAMADSPRAPSLPAAFSVTYTNPPQLTGAFWYSWQTMLIVLLILVGCPVWVWRVLLYMRQKANAPMDLELLLFAGISAADVFSFTLALVLFLVSFYWLVLIKLQEGVLLLMLPDAQLHNFWVTMVLALVGQSLGLLKMLYEQISVDIFFLDWEKPRRVLAKGGGREEPGPVSAWRGLLVANEWNELQTARLTCPSFTLIFMVFILQGANMQAAAYINPDQNDYTSYANVQQSMLLRFGIAAVWFLVLGVAQVLWKVAVVHRFAGHPLHGFIDLLFLANTSAIILDERHSGYYLHGRNQMHHSDTSLAELNGSLLREEEGLVAGRGLITGYTGSVASISGGLLASGPDAAALNDNQVFLMHVSPELRRRYESTLLSQVEQAAQEQRANKGAVTSAVRGPSRPRGSSMSASASIAEAFKAALDEVERNYSTQVIIPTYWQRMFRLPPTAAASSTLLTHDFHAGFASVLFYGQELRMFVFEALLFCSLHMTLGNAAVAGFVTLLVQRLLAVVRRHWGENNLSRKTLVDRHFLI
uniref:Meckelin n=1 Tax=Tetradesmus obliquus TaxID=3088 RepID=A0A383WB01_TETOB|eukprot:jgi/Sobl393_1/4904/SZX73866.1